jgi:hypothetical protein
MRGILVAAVAAAIAVSGCGSDEAQVVKSAFENEIDSAQVEITMVSSENGAERRITLAGPYKSNGDDKLPSVDLKLDMAAAQNLSARLVTSPDNAFVVYDGETYEVGKDEVGKLKRKGNVNLQGLMGRMRDWFPETTAPVNATLDGEPVRRVTGKLNVTEALKDLNGADMKNVQQLATAISNPHFTVDVGRDDGKLRRVEVAAHVKNEGREGDLLFSIRLKAIDKPVTINAPSSGKPIGDLAQQIVGSLGFGDLSGDSPDSKLRLGVLGSYADAIKAITRWNAAMKKFEKDGDYTTAASKTRTLAQDLDLTRMVVEQAQPESAGSKAKMEAVLKAVSDMRDQADAMASALEQDDKQRKLATYVNQFIAAAGRYDKAVAAFKSSP